MLKTPRLFGHFGNPLHTATAATQQGRSWLTVGDLV